MENYKAIIFGLPQSSQPLKQKGRRRHQNRGAGIQMLAESTHLNLQHNALPTELTHVTARAGNARCRCCFRVVGRMAGP